MRARRVRAVAMVEEARPHIRRTVRNVYRAVPDQSGVFSLEDVEQEVIARLLAEPPLELDEARPRLAAVRAWVKRAARRLLIDRNRREDTRRRNAPNHRFDTGPRALDRTEARRELERIGELLAEQYPKGLELLRALERTPDGSAADLARALGTTPANVHQIRSRIRKLLAAAL